MSELGRFPQLNHDEGKDHFPECPCVFIGGSVNTNKGTGVAFGGTGREMAAVPIRLTDGRPSGRDGDFALQLDDLGATVLHMVAGADPRMYGYGGRVLEFLL